MFIFSKKFIWVVVGFIFLITNPILAKDKNELKSLMHKNFQALLKLQELSLDEKTFYNPDNHQQIKKYLNQLNQAAHKLPKTVSQSQKPSLQAISEIFDDYLSDLRRSFNKGYKTPYIRNQIQTVSGFCFSCHSSVESKSSFGFLKQVQSLPLHPVQRAKFYVAIRQFDEAIKIYQKILSEIPLEETDLHQWTQALSNALSISVRVKQDPKLTLAFIKKAQAQPKLPFFLKRSLQQWEKDTQQWMQENKSGFNLMAKAKELIKSGQSLQTFPSEPISDIRYLRATYYLHQALSQSLKEPEQAEAYYLLGIANWALDDPFLWDLDEYYFQTCIRKSPHSDIARQCYQRLAAEIYFGFTGSGGTFIPDEQKQRLKKLHELAE